jgi:hypothetical protein
MTINPRVGLYLSLLGVILGVLATAGASLTTIFGAHGAEIIAAAAPLLLTIISGVNGVLHMIPSADTPAATAKFMLGPSPPPATPLQAAAPAVPSGNGTAPAAKVVALLAILILGTLMVATPGHAQNRPLTGNIVNDLRKAAPNASLIQTLGDGDLVKVLAKPFQDLAEFLSSDAAAAIALSTQIPSLQDGHGQQCWIAMSTAGDVFKAHPVPLTLKVMTDVEALRLLAMTANNLCSNVHCTQVFADLTTMAQAASPVPLPIPGLHDLCSKIPQIAQVAAITPPVAAETVATPAAPVK